MAGAGQPFYMPLLWPMGNVAIALSSGPIGVKVPKPTASAQLDLIGHLTSLCAASRSFLLACLITYGFYDGWDYPAFGRAKTLEFSWIWPIIARDVVATWVICGCWDFLLYGGFGSKALKQKLFKFKINPVYPSMDQIRHDAIATTIASLTAAALEIVFCHLWCIGVFPKFEPRLAARPLHNLVWATTITHWRIPHFWAVHRLMHPWKTTAIPDIGRPSREPTCTPWRAPCTTIRRPSREPTCTPWRAPCTTVRR